MQLLSHDYAILYEEGELWMGNRNNREKENPLKLLPQRSKKLIKIVWFVN